jgi:prepilin-type N-terminal cleavage/methylation domain-containing protein
MTALRDGRVKGFSLIELMVAVAILGILSATAIPAFVRYTRKARTSEARQNVRKIYDAAREYYMEPHYADVVGMTGAMTPRFPAGDFSTTGQHPSCCIWNPASENPMCPPVASVWETPRWRALKFSMSDPHYFVYLYGAWAADQYFNTGAHADQDCDGAWSHFQMHGFADPTYADGPIGTGLMIRWNELE